MPTSARSLCKSLATVRCGHRTLHLLSHVYSFKMFNATAPYRYYHREHLTLVFY